MNIKDDAQEWFESQGAEIQDYEVPPMPDDEPTAEELEELEAAEYAEEHPYADAPRVTGEDAASVLNMQRINRPTAAIIVGVMDSVLPLLLALVIKGSELEDGKLDEGERETLTDAWAVYLGDKNVQASPLAVLLVTVVTIYGAKVFAALQSRKAAEAAAKAAAAQAAAQTETGEQ